MSDLQDRLHQYFKFISAGISDLVPYGNGTEVDPDTPICAECGWVWPDDQETCRGCGNDGTGSNTPAGGA